MMIVGGEGWNGIKVEIELWGTTMGKAMIEVVVWS